ncbi:MAG: PAS domain S-box protein [Caldilineaceae bacterium]
MTTPIPGFAHSDMTPSELWTNQEVLKLILSSAPVALVLVNEAGRILFANPKLLDMFGYTFQEVQDQPIELLIPRRFRKDHVQHRARYVTNPHVRPMGTGIDLIGRRKDGEEFPLEAGLSFLHTDQGLLVVSSISNITKRKQTEELLEQRVEERTHELERRREVSDGLRDILAILNSNQSIEDILNQIAAQACSLLRADASAIFRMHGKRGALQMQASHGLPEEFASQRKHPPDLEPDSGQRAGQQTGAEQDEDEAYNENIEVLKLVSGSNPTNAIRVLHTEDALSIISAGAATDGEDELVSTTQQPYQAVFSVPILIKNEVYGSLALYYREPRKFSAEEIELATTFGDQTALAIENARLRTQVERAAVAEERNRIARDLHDSVTQTLFSASLIAEVLPRMWESDREESEKRLAELRQLTRGALAEMRTLLLELRPATLIEVQLRELLRQLTEATTGRTRIPIRLELQGEGPLPPDVKIAFYHVAQEALNNVAKHAKATHVTVTFKRTQTRGQLTVTDDGRGFVIEKVTPEHLGLTIMNERAESIGARLQIESRLGHGTSVTVIWNNQDK